MWRHGFCTILISAGTTVAAAQNVPGRDLLEFPIGSVAEAPSLATLAGLGIWNPAASVLDSSVRWQLAAATMDGPSAQGVSGQLLSTALSISSIGTISVSWLAANVADLVRTESDPQSVGPDIRYGTSVLSFGLSRNFSRTLSLGVAVREHRGNLDDIRASSHSPHS
jgi:hypothetical protein